MRILLAIDGSASSDRATQLVAGFNLPTDSLVRVVSIQRRNSDLLAVSGASMGEGSTHTETGKESDARRHREAVDRAQAELARPGLNVEGFMRHGRPGTAIVDEASAMSADLVVVGSRGHGTIATMMLGSTASEVVDHASCPILSPATTISSRSRSPTTARSPPSTRRPCSPGRSSPACRSA